MHTSKLDAFIGEYDEKYLEEAGSYVSIIYYEMCCVKQTSFFWSK